MLTANPSAPLLLVVEDDDSHVYLIQHSLDNDVDEYRLEVVGTLRNAIEAVERQRPDLVLTNYTLADGCGSDLVAKVNGECPVILMTGQGNEQLAVTTIKAGALDYIPKSPETFSSLPRIIKMALLEWRLLQERRNIYQAVSRGKREWEQTFDAVPDLIFIVDTEHTISRANRAVSERCGLRPEDLPGRKCYEFFHGLSAPPPFCPNGSRIKDVRLKIEDVEETQLGGFFDITVSPLYDDTGKLTACVHVARDVTDRKKAEQERLALEQQLQQAQKLESLGVLAGGIAHDFNNILMIILGHCFLAKEEAGTGFAEQGHIGQIEIAANRAADLCRQMLTYAGKSPLLQTQVDLRLWVDEIVKMLRSAFKKNVSFQCDLQAEVPEITGDKAKIQQIVMNLVVNAVEAIGEDNGVVRVGLAHTVVPPEGGELDFFGHPILPGPYVCLQVSDTGCGMEEETQKRIFEPFFTTKFAGRGLGMSAILGIIKSHNGALQLSSKVGQGTTFRIYFPVTGDQERAEEGQPAADLAPDLSQHGMARTVLLIDDEEELRRVGADMLAAMGFSVITAANGREALEMFRDIGSMIDLVLTDLTMPELDGIETYRELRQIAPYLPIVICSGYGNDDLCSSIDDDPHAGFVAKPYRPDQVRDLLARLLYHPPSPPRPSPTATAKRPLA